MTVNAGDAAFTRAARSMRIGNVIGCLVGLTVSAPAYLYGFALYLKPIQADTGWHRGAILLGMAIAALTAAILAPAVGVLIDRVGGKRVSLAGCIVMPAGLALLGQPHSYAMYLAVAALGGIGCALASAPAYLSLLPQWFDRHLGAAIAIAATGIGLASIIIPLAAQALIGHLGWRGALAVLGAALFVIGLTNNLLLVRENPEFAALRNRRRAGEPQAEIPGTAFAAAIRTADFWKFSIAFLLIVAIVSACYTNMAALAIDRGFTAAQAAIALSVYGASAIAAHLLTGFLIDRVPIGVPTCTFFGGTGIGMLMLWYGWPPGNLFLVAALLGMATGCEGDLMPYVVRRRFGLRAYGRLYGIMFGVFQIGPIVAPLGLGIMYDHLGSYDAAFPVFATLALAAVGLFASTSIAWTWPLTGAPLAGVTAGQIIGGDTYAQRSGRSRSKS